MKLALSIGYSGATLDVPIELIQHAERLGFDSVWTAEAYGSDAITPLAWIAAQDHPDPARDRDHAAGRATPRRCARCSA